MSKDCSNQAQTTSAPLYCDIRAQGTRVSITLRKTSEDASSDAAHQTFDSTLKSGTRCAMQSSSTSIGIVANHEPGEGDPAAKIIDLRDTAFDPVDGEIIPSNILKYEKEKRTPYNLFSGPLKGLNKLL